MISVSDIVKLLEQIPIWKSLIGLPKRIAELEQRVAALETKAVAPARTIPKGRECPSCGEEMRLCSERADPIMGDVGIKQHSLECPGCQFKTTRSFAPGRGYL